MLPLLPDTKHCKTVGDEMPVVRVLSWSSGGGHHPGSEARETGKGSSSGLWHG